MHTVVSILLVLPLLVFCCHEPTHYMKDGQCCKMCAPGKRMKQNTDCNDPICEECENGEYQDGYTKETKCKRQPLCDSNLNFVVPDNPSKTELTPCQCIPDYHCSSKECMACYRNTVCKPGERVSKQGTKMSDRECEPCPHGSFSAGNSSINCIPWTKCPSGHSETVPGSPTSDRACEANLRLGILISVLTVIGIGIVVISILWYKKEKTGTACLEEKFQKHCPAFFSDLKNQHQPVEEKVTVENEQPMNVQPEENMEEPAKQDDNYKYGLSANGMPVDQDHSKSSLLSSPETSPSEVGYSERF